MCFLLLSTSFGILDTETLPCLLLLGSVSVEEPDVSAGEHSVNNKITNIRIGLKNNELSILGDPGAASRDDGIFMGESLQQERECPWALTLTERVPEAFGIPPSDWPEKFFSGQSTKRNSRATLMSSYTRLFSSSIAVVVAWPVQREHFLGELQKKKINTK